MTIPLALGLFTSSAPCAQPTLKWLHLLFRSRETCGGMLSALDTAMQWWDGLRWLHDYDGGDDDAFADQTQWHLELTFTTKANSADKSGKQQSRRHWRALNKPADCHRHGGGRTCHTAAEQRPWSVWGRCWAHSPCSEQSTCSHDPNRRHSAWTTCWIPPPVTQTNS